MNTSATNEQRQRFERLCLYRALYSRSGPRDTVSVMSLRDAVRYAEGLLVQLAGHATPATLQSPSSASSHDN